VAALASNSLVAKVNSILFLPQSGIGLPDFNKNLVPKVIYLIPGGAKKLEKAPSPI